MRLIIVDSNIELKKIKVGFQFAFNCGRFRYYLKLNENMDIVQLLKVEIP